MDHGARFGHASEELRRAASCEDEEQQQKGKGKYLARQGSASFSRKVGKGEQSESKIPKFINLISTIYLCIL